MPPNSLQWRSKADPEAHRVLRDGSRLAVVRATNLLNGGSDEVLDGLARVVCTMLGVPVSAVSLVDDRGQSFVGLHGLTGWADLARGTPLSHSFCQHVVIGDAPLIVENAPLDPRVRDNLAVNELGVIAYAGVPLTTRDGETMGALCAIDTVPRTWTEIELQTLRDLSAAAVAQLQLRAALDEVTSAYESMRLDQNAAAVRHHADAYDALTGLHSRAGFERAVRDAARSTTAATPTYLLHSLHVEGDDSAMLSVAESLTKLVSPEACCARIAARTLAVLEPVHASQELLMPQLHTALVRANHAYAIRHGSIALPPAFSQSTGLLLRAADEIRDQAEWWHVAAEHAPRMASTKRVLLLDDYPSTMDWARTALELHGWTVFTAVATDEALSLAAQLRLDGTPIDVVLFDETLDGIDGDSVGMMLRFDGATLPVVRLCRALAQPREAARFVHPLHANLTKPLSPGTLRTSLNDAVNQAPLAIAHAAVHHADVS